MLKSRYWGTMLGWVTVSAAGLTVLVATTVHAVSLTCPTTSAASTTPTVTVGGIDSSCGSVPADLKKALLDAGYSNAAAAGIMGNIQGESRFRVNVVEHGELVGDDFVAYDLVKNKRSDKLINSTGGNLGFGLAQWTTDGRVKSLQSYAERVGKPVVSAAAQIGYLIEELASYGLSTSALKSFTVDEVTWVMLRDFETPLNVFCVGSECSGSVQNTASARHTSLSDLLANKDSYAAAYGTFSTRLAFAKNWESLDVSKCSGGASSDEGEDAPDPTPTDGGGGSGGSSGGGESSGGGGSSGDSGGGAGGSSGGGGSTEPTTSGGTTGALGAKNANNMVGQFDAGVKDVVWRTDGSTVGASGCSLVSVVNAARTLGHAKDSVNVSSLASWTKSRISSANWDNLKTMAKHVGLSVSSWLWSSKSTSDATKIAKIRDTLASGGVVIAGGDRAGTSSSFCTSSRLSGGECVFTPGGHFVAIIGITADNKLVIANPAKGSKSATGWIFPASGVLKYSNKAIMVK